MNTRSTFLLILLAGGIFAYIWFVDAKQVRTRDRIRDGDKVVQLDRDNINAISIKNAETEIELRKQDNEVWTIEKPVKDRADTLMISSLFTSAEYLKYDAVLGDDQPVEKDQLKEYGLANPDLKITFSGGGPPVSLLIGKDAAVEGKAYVKLADSKKVYVIGADLKNLVVKKANDFRDRKLSELTTAQVNKVQITTTSGEIELVKKDGHWAITKPLKARADDSKVSDAVAQAITARVESFAEDSANLTTYGLQEPRGTFSMFIEGSEKPAVLQIGASLAGEENKELTYAKLSTREAVVILSKNIEALIRLTPNDLRDQQLVRFEEDIVDRMNIESPGKGKLILARAGESWVQKGEKDQPVNQATATRLLKSLGSQAVTKFVADVATEIASYGLDQPAVSITLSSYASENTAETKQGEKPIVTVHFGKAEGDIVYAKLADEPFIVSVHQSILDSIPTDAIQWQEVVIYKNKADDLTSLEITRGDQPAILLEREKDQWQLAKGDGNLNQINAQSLTNTLANVRAVRWVGPTAPVHGFDKPTASVAFKAGASTGRLTVGAMSPDETWYATAEGLPGTFQMSRPDVEALLLPLLDKAVPPATAPTTPPTPPVAPAPPVNPAVPALPPQP